MRSRILVVPWFLAMWIAVLAGLSAVAPASAHAQHWELRAGAALPLGELAERGVGTGLGIDLGLRLPVGRRGFARALAGGYRAPGDLGSAFYALHYQVGMGIVGEALPAGWTVSGDVLLGGTSFSASGTHLLIDPEFLGVTLRTRPAVSTGLEVARRVGGRLDLLGVARWFETPCACALRALAWIPKP